MYKSFNGKNINSTVQFYKPVLGDSVCLIEREDGIARLNNFLDCLPREKRGILRVVGASGSGRTCFLNEIAHKAFEHNFEIVFLNEEENIYGLHAKYKFMDIDTQKVDILRFEKDIVKRLKKSNKNGVLLIIDNALNIDNSALNFVRKVLTSKIPANLGLIYSNEPDSIFSMDYLDIPLYDTICLNALSPKGVQVWVKSTLEWEKAPEAFVKWLYSKTGGLPKLLKESVKYLNYKGFLKYDFDSGWYIEGDYYNIELHNKGRREKRIQKNNLPAALTSFIGRKREIEKINDMLKKGRMITLLGLGGIGKTRLALEVAKMRLNDFKDGVFIVPLASITQPEIVVSSIAKALNITEISGQHIFYTLKNALYDKQTLLILDNFEQVMEAASIVSELLLSAPNLNIIVTSRESLRLTGEYTFIVPPLEIPETVQNMALKDLESQPAIALFLARAKAVQYDFELTDENAPFLAELCARLDGIPLAIELAAANIGEISLSEMLKQCRSRLDWLKNGARDLPERHKALKNTIEWGYSFLSKSHQKLFNRLGVFKIKFDLKALRAVVNRDNALGADMEEGLISLINKSFVRKVSYLKENDEQQFEMLETIHEYAVEMLAMSEEEAVIKDYHADYYLSLAVEARKNVNGPDKQLWLNRLEHAHSNILAAMEYLQASGDSEKELKLATSLGHFWETRGYWNEGQARLEMIVKRQETVPELEHVRLYLWYGRLTNLKGDHDKAIDILNNALELSRKADDREGEATILYKLALALSIQGNLTKEAELLQQSLAIYRIIDNKSGMAAVLQDLGQVYYYQGEYERAELCSDESLDICRELKDKWGISRALGRLGLVARGKGNVQQAMKLFDDYLTSCEELDDKEGITYALINIAELARSQQDYDFAREYYERCLKLGRELGYKSITARALKDLGEIARYEGDFDKAAGLFQESIDVLKESNDNGEMMWLYRNMAELEMHKQCYSTAKELYLKGLKIYRESKQITLIFILLVFEGLAEIASGEEQLERAARLLGAADKLFEVGGKLIAKSDFDEYKIRHNKVRERMDKKTYDKAWSEGNSMSFELVLDYAIEEKDENIGSDMANKMVNYIRENYSKDISLTDISEYFNMSSCYLSTMFKYYTGENFKDYLNFYRVEKAKDLLQNSNLKINDVARLVGCNNINTFIRIFKKYEGISPGQYIEKK